MFAYSFNAYVCKRQLLHAQLSHFCSLVSQAFGWHLDYYVVIFLKTCETIQKLNWKFDHLGLGVTTHNLANYF